MLTKPTMNTLHNNHNHMVKHVYYLLNHKALGFQIWSQMVAWVFHRNILDLTMLKIHAELFDGCTIYIMICYNYFILFILHLFYSTHYFSMNNLSTLILSSMIFRIYTTFQIFFSVDSIFCL